MAQVERCGCDEAVALRRQLARAKRLAHKLRDIPGNWTDDECELFTELVAVLEEKV
jgi:hypothetical protein